MAFPGSSVAIRNRNPSPLPHPMARLLAARKVALARSALRFRISRALSGKVDLVELKLSEEPSSGAGGNTSTAVEDHQEEGRRLLEDAIQGAIARRVAPDWLPFVPGASYWVPPMPRSLGVSDLFGAALTARSAAAMTTDEALNFTTVRGWAMTEEEALSLTAVQGWPSAAYFLEGKSLHPVKRSREDATQTDDEES